MIVASLLSTVLTLGWSVAVDVGGRACPASAAVTERLASLLPPDAAGAPDRARIETVAPGTIEVTLRAPDGTLIGARRLPVSSDCDDMARSVAVILGTWESDVHPAYALPSAPVPVARPLAPVPVAARSAQSADVAPAMSMRAVASAGPVLGTSTSWDVGAGLLGSVADGQLAPGVEIVAALSPWGRWGGRLAATIDGAREVTAGAGRGRWSRAALAIGPQVRFGGPRLAAEAHVSAQVARFSARGESYPVSYEGTGVDAGVLGGVRLIGPGVRVRPWLALDGGRWLGRRTVRELVDGQEQPIAAWSASAAVGVSFFSP